MALSKADLDDKKKVFDEIKRSYSSQSKNWREQDFDYKKPDVQWFNKVWKDTADAFSVTITPAVSTTFRVDRLGLDKDFPRTGPTKKIMTWSAGSIGR
jgi:hypothetical protein